MSNEKKIVLNDEINEKDIEKIAEKMLGDTVKKLKEKDIEAEISPEIYSYIAKKGYDKIFGARNLRRILVAEIENPVSEILCSYADVRRIKISLVNSKPSFDVSEA